MKILVGQDDINLDKPDNGGQTPLSWAAVLGRGEMVEILLGRDGVRMPFWYGSKYGNVGVVVLLQSLASAITWTAYEGRVKEASPALRPSSIDNRRPIPAGPL